MRIGKGLRLLCVLAMVVITVPGYGYWHAKTHAAFSIQINVQGTSADAQGFVPGAELTLLDARGRELATGQNDLQYNYTRLIHPQAGDCKAAEHAASTSQVGRKAWKACFEQMSTWIVQWADEVRSISLTTPHCRWLAVPVQVKKYDADWFLWWVPLPHVGGLSYTYYSLYVTLHEDDCIRLSG